MAKLKVRWFHTEEFEAEFEVDGYDPDANEPHEEILEQIANMDQQELSDAFEGCTEREVTDVEVIRDGEDAPEIVMAAPVHEEMF